MRVVRRAAVLILLGLILAVPEASLAKARAENAQPEIRGAVFNALDLLSSLGHFLTHLGLKAGCRLDPLGQCIASAPTLDEGCGGDPLGCTQTQDTEAGCVIDPLGSCNPDY